MNTTYTVYHCTEAPEAPMGLSPAEVVRHIYNHDGESYCLKPSLVEIETDDGDIIGEEQETLVNGTNVWEVVFATRFGAQTQTRLTYGNTEEEAEQAFLRECFNEVRWDDTKWIVTSDFDFLNEIT